MADATEAASNALGGAAEVVQRKVAGLPLWAWAGIAGAGMALFTRLRARRAAAGDDSQPQATEGGATVAPLPSDGLPLGGGVAPGYNQAPATGPSTMPSSEGYASNDAWKRAAFAALLARGYEAFSIDVALAKYLAGETLSQADAAIVGAAVALIGPPPSPAQSTPTTSPPPVPPKPPTSTPTQPATPSSDVTPPIVLGNPPPYPWNLIKYVYGTVNSGMVSRFAAANGLTFDGNQVRPWKAGMTVKFPASVKG